MNLTLVNYRHSSSTPYNSIMQLPMDQAFEIAAKLNKSSQCQAHRRFGPDFEFYYKYRLKIEKVLYIEFVQLGGKPKYKHPFYFVLEYSDVLHRNFDSGMSVALPLNHIDPLDVSFCFGDSMAQFESGNRQPIFTVDTLYQYIGNNNNEVDLLLHEIIPQYKYIEAQLWTDKYFPDREE